MSATGIVRRIDELGRIVIPKEIRKTLRIQEGENIEISLDNKENIVLKKYSIMKHLNDFAQNFTESIYHFLKKDIMISDMDTIIAASGSNKKAYLNKNLSSEFLESIKSGTFKHEELININMIENNHIDTPYRIEKIQMNGDIVGLIILFSDNITELETNIIRIVSSFFTKYLED